MYRRAFLASMVGVPAVAALAVAAEPVETFLYVVRFGQRTTYAECFVAVKSLVQRTGAVLHEAGGHRIFEVRTPDGRLTAEKEVILSFTCTQAQWEAKKQYLDRIVGEYLTIPKAV